MSQIHKRFTSDQVKELLEREYIQEIPGIQRRRFFVLRKQYQENPKNFTIHHERNTPPRIPPGMEQNILRELSIEKGIIQNPEIPVKSCHYSYAR